ncbi:MAG TPA: DUF5678 domain-containing protein [Patescibacteria group bacterium]|nr:DUF5678 domain-containing protein [Patescibacteria group bacterium]
MIISNFESLNEEDMSKYAGKWIAIIDNQVVANKNSFKEIYEFTKMKFPNKKPLFGKLPEATIISFSII